MLLKLDQHMLISCAGQVAVGLGCYLPQMRHRRVDWTVVEDGVDENSELTKGSTSLGVLLLKLDQHHENTLNMCWSSCSWIGLGCCLPQMRHRLVDWTVVEDGVDENSELKGSTSLGVLLLKLDQHHGTHSEHVLGKF